MSTGADDLCDKKDPFQVDLTVEHAIRLLQKNERGRIGIQRAMMIANFRREAQKKEQRSKQGLPAQEEMSEKVTYKYRIHSNFSRKMIINFLGWSYYRSSSLSLLSISNPFKITSHDQVLLEKQAMCASLIAAHWRRKLVQRKFQRMKQEEFVFLGMILPSQTGMDNPQPGVDHAAISEYVEDVFLSA